MRVIALLLFTFIAFSVKAQNSYSSIGVVGSYFIPSGSIPIQYSNNKAHAFGVFYEHYFINNFKVKVGISNFNTTYTDKYTDTSDNPQRYYFDATARFISIPLIFSYNFDANNKDWEFFVNAGYNLFIQQHNKTENFAANSALRPIYEKNISNYNNYFIVGFEGRYKLDEHLYAGVGTLSYHYLKFNSNIGKGFPTLSIDASLAYVF